MKEGIYQNTKVFAGHYNVKADGAFIPLVRTTAKGDTLVDESKYVDINGVTIADFKVQPFLKIEWIGTLLYSIASLTMKMGASTQTSKCISTIP